MKLPFFEQHYSPWVIHKPATGESQRLRYGTNTFGSNPFADVRSNCGHISYYHAYIQISLYSNRAYLFVDARANSSTFLNNEEYFCPGIPHFLVPYDWISCGIEVYKGNKTKDPVYQIKFDPMPSHEKKQPSTFVTDAVLENYCNCNDCFSNTLTHMLRQYFFHDVIEEIFGYDHSLFII